MDIPWYVDFFREGFYHRWGPADRFQRAEREVDFIEEALGLPAGASVFDLCCGTAATQCPLPNAVLR